MNPATLGVLIAILVPLGFFALIFGIYYLRNKEKMAMIERGLEPVETVPRKRDNTSVTLTSGLLLIGAGLGLLFAFLLDNLLFSSRISNVDTTALYFSLIAIFGGLGLVVSYIIERKANQKKEL